MPSENQKLLYCASSNRHLLHFHLPYIAMIKAMDISVDILSSGSSEDFPEHAFYHIPFYKSITSPKNIGNILKIRRIILANDYQFIILNTALTAALVRLAIPAKMRKRIRVINICHGYFFGLGVSTFKNIMYRSIEKLLSRKTDNIITMNSEDYDYARKDHLCRQVVYFVHGMGYRSNKFSPVKTKSTGPSIRLLYVAEHSNRKNHSELLVSFADAVKNGADLTLALAGDGALFEENKALSNTLGIADRVSFLGYIDDVANEYHKCDYVVSPSRIEGLPFNIMEALACGLPCIVSDVKGHRDLVTDGDNGYVYPLGDKAQLTRILAGLSKDSVLYQKMRKQAAASVKPNRLKNTLEEFKRIYQDILL